MARPLRRQPRCRVLERRLGRNLGTGRQSHPDTFEILQRPGRDIARHVEKLRPGSRLRRQTRRGGACLRGADPPRVAEVALPLHGRRAGARRCDARGLLPFRRGPRVRRQHPEGDHPRHPERQHHALPRGQGHGPRQQLRRLRHRTQTAFLHDVRQRQKRKLLDQQGRRQSQRRRNDCRGHFDRHRRRIGQRIGADDHRDAAFAHRLHRRGPADSGYDRPRDTFAGVYRDPHRHRRPFVLGRFDRCRDAHGR